MFCQIVPCKHCCILIPTKLSTSNQFKKISIWLLTGGQQLNGYRPGFEMATDFQFDRAKNIFISMEQFGCCNTFEEERSFSENFKDSNHKLI